MISLVRRVVVFVFSLALAQAAAAAPSTQRLYLSGRDKDNTVSWRFLCTSGANSGVWTNLPVPSHWDMKGFGTLTYSKDATNAWNERGLYQRDFTVPRSWTGKRVSLVFEGVMTDTTAKLNGQTVGPTHQGGFYRFKYEVTRQVRAGKRNRLEVEVARHSANESVNRAERLADYWVFAGIYRPVYLEAVPESFIERVAIDARADGAFRMDVFVSGAAETGLVEAQVRTLGGKKVGTSFSANVTEGKATLKNTIPSPRQWTAETPDLYQVEVRLKRAARTLHVYRQRFGFRTFEVRDGDGLYLNGRKLTLKGVNRHSFWPDSGRCLSAAVHRLDIETIKGMNGNSVRMSHYPPDTEFLDLCDELGLYVLDELAGWQKRYDTETGTRLVESMVTRDVNHPCILFWDNGNEGGFNLDLDPLFGRFDPQQRRVLHPWAVFSGINTAHYLAYSNAEVAARGEPMNYQEKLRKELVNTIDPAGLIYLPTEFLHGLYDGGAGAGLADYWGMMMAHSNCAGGFIWVLADEAVKRPDTGELNTAGNQAPDGIVGPYREREGSFYAIKEIWAPKKTDASARHPYPAAARRALKEVQLKPNVAVVERFDLFGSPAAQVIELESKQLAARIDGRSGQLLGVRTGTGSFSLANGPRLVATNAQFTRLTWQLRADGWLQCQYTYTASGTNDCLGVAFDFPEESVRSKRWLGQGPYRVWKNRLEGGTLGVWRNDYNDTITGYRGWVYPEFKGCFRDVRWLELETTEGRITVVPQNVPFLQVLTPEFPPENLVGHALARLPKCGLGLLHAIPPIGTKFKPASEGGPQGQPNIARGEYSGVVSFHFGKR